VQTLVDISGVAEFNSGVQIGQASSVSQLAGMEMYAHALGKRDVVPAPAHAPAGGRWSTAVAPPSFDSVLRIGANTTIQSLIHFLSGPQMAQGGAGVIAAAIVVHLKRVAGRQLRNAGSIAGSLAMSRYWNFPGDTSVKQFKTTNHVQGCHQARSLCVLNPALISTSSSSFCFCFFLFLCVVFMAPCAQLGRA